jgi:hypothetical protein
MERLFVFAEPEPPGTFTGRLESAREVIVERTDRPLVEAARRLIAMGFDPEAPLTMRHAGKTFDSFKPQPIREWAKWTYRESEKTELRAVRWRPFPGARYRPKQDSDMVAGWEALPSAGWQK